MKNFFAIAALAALAACGGGGGGGSTGGGSGTIPAPTVTPTPVKTPSNFPKASGHAMAFFAAGATHGNQARRSIASAVIAGSRLAKTPGAYVVQPTRYLINATATATPSPTPVPLPTPSGNPLIPTRVAVGQGANATVGSYMVMQVVDANATPLPEPSAPAMQSSRPDVLNPAPAIQFPDQTTFPNSWQSYFGYGTSPQPQHIQFAAVFPDSTGIVDVYSYDAFYIDCVNTQSVAVTSGIAQSASNGDVQMQNCSTTPNIAFAHGYMVVAPPQADAFGQLLPSFNNLLQAQPFATHGTTIDQATLASLVGAIIQAPDANGVQHKYMINFIENGSDYTVTFVHLSADVAGTFAF